VKIVASFQNPQRHSVVPCYTQPKQRPRMKWHNDFPRKLHISGLRWRPTLVA
jgi:hypothetical protein